MAENKLKRLSCETLTKTCLDNGILIEPTFKKMDMIRILLEKNISVECKTGPVKRLVQTTCDSFIIRRGSDKKKSKTRKQRVEEIVNSIKLDLNMLDLQVSNHTSDVCMQYNNLVLTRTGTCIGKCMGDNSIGKLSIEDVDLCKQLGIVFSPIHYF
jgi:hypothetical protein